MAERECGKFEHYGQMRPQLGSEWARRPAGEVAELRAYGSVHASAIARAAIFTPDPMTASARYPDMWLQYGHTGQLHPEGEPKGPTTPAGQPPVAYQVNDEADKRAARLQRVRPQTQVLLMRLTADRRQ